MHEMRVLFSTIKGGLNGGANIASFFLIQDLKRRGVDVHVAVQKGDFWDRLNETGVPCYEVKKIPFFAWPRILNWKYLVLWPYSMFMVLYWNWRSTRRMVDVIRRVKPDFVETCNSPTLYGFFAANITKTPHIWHLREFLGLNVDINVLPNNRYFFRHWLPKSYTISITQEVRTYFGCTNPKKDFVVTDGVMHENEIQYIEEKGNYYLFVGWVDQSKGCDDLIDAFIIYAQKHKENELWLAGKYSDDYKKELEQRIRNSNISIDRIRFLGFRSDRYLLMAKAQATIVPSQLEGFGFITVEAMMNGCIVIGRNTGGTKMIMERAKGCELPFDTTLQMALCMEEVQIKGSRFYKDRIIRAQKVAQHDFSIERCGLEVLEIYEKLAKQNKHV